MEKEEAILFLEKRETLGKEKKETEFTPEAIAKKFNIDLRKLELEQRKVAEAVSLKDAIDFNLADRIAGCDTAIVNNRIIAAIVVLDKDMQILEQQYVVKKAEFPYLPGFRAYRELPAMTECFNKLQEQPDVLFIEGHGIAHPRKCGIAAHFGIIIQKPTIGIAKNLLMGEAKDGDIIINGKVCGFKLQTKEGSKPIYISSGNMISLKTALELTKKFIVKPHKLPEPLVQARKYANKIREELGQS